jgi:hypothetical protein
MPFLALAFTLSLSRLVHSQTPVTSAPQLNPSLSPVGTLVAEAPARESVGAPTDGAPSVGVPRAECFPIEKLRPELRAKAEEVLLHACDREALYTLVGAIKPMSSGWLSVSFSLDKPNPKSADDMREIVAALRCGDEISAQLYTYAMPQGRRVLLEGAMFSRPALRRMIATRQEFWNGFAITPQAEPLAVLLPTEHADMATRYRGYGYLFGYPKHAVDFFVTSSQQRDTDPNKKLVPRDFLSIPTFDRETNAFVYAVPKGQAPNAEDLALRARCAPIFAEYKRRRAQYIGAGKPGIVALLRDWFDSGQGVCSPSFARIPGGNS